MIADSVLFVTPRWARDGGVGAHVQRSAALLGARGVSVEVLVARIESDELPEGVRLRHSPSLFKTELPLGERLAGALEEPPGLVHLHQVDEPPLARAAHALAPLVVSAHGYTACTAGVHYFRPGQECERAHGPGCVPNLLLRGCSHTRNPTGLPKRYALAAQGLETLREADVAISYSTAVDRHLGVNGVDARALVPYFPTIEPRAAEGHEDRRRVVFAGRVAPPKGVEVLLRAMGELDAELAVCGDGWHLPAMRALAERLGIAERVRFTGWLDPDGLGAEIAAGSVLALPSLWPEPFGLVGIEAHDAGRPAVASATGGVGDWLADGVSGISVPPGDARALARALASLLDDPERRREMGEAGRRSVAERFSPDRHLAALEAAYARAGEAWRGGGAARSGSAIASSV